MRACDANGSISFSVSDFESRPTALRSRLAGGALAVASTRHFGWAAAADSAAAGDAGAESPRLFFDPIRSVGQTVEPPSQSAFAPTVM